MKKIVLLFLLVISMSLWGKEINGNYSNFLYYKDAMKSGSEVRITPDEGGKRGAVWSRNIFDLNEKFHFEYEIYLGTKGIESFENLKKENPNLNMEDRYISNGNVDIGADGMAFAFKSSAYKNDHYGDAGQSIGYGGGNFPLSFGVKFDTYTNPYYDPQYNSNIDSVENLTEDHIAFIAKGKIGTMIDSGITGGRGPAPYKEVGDMEDGKWHKVTFDWDPGVVDSYGNRSGSKFTYTFDNNDGTLYTDTYSEDIIKNYLGNDRYVYFGFTSSTGQWMNEHKFRNPEIKGTIPTDDYKLDIKKEVVNGNNYTLANDKDNPIKYKITITNTGSETLTNIILKDGKDISGGAIASDVILETSTWNELKAGQSVVTYGTKVAIQADIDEGSVIRTATVEAQKSNGEKLYAAAEAIVYPNIVEGLEVSKIIETEGEFKYTKAGDVIIYNFSIKNTGTTTLTDVSVSDLKIPGIKLTPTTLAPNAIATGTGSYTVIQADVDKGKVDNTANFRAVKPDGNVIGKSSTVTALGKVTNTYEVSNTPVITDKDGAPLTEYLSVGDIVTYTLSLTNTGNGTLKTPMVKDTNSSTKVSLGKVELAPGETTSIEVTHTVTQKDLDDGKILNPAVFDVTDVNGTALEPQTKDAPVNGDITNSYTVDNQAVIADKDGAPLTEYSSVGDIVTYTLSLTNTGNGTLKTPMVKDTNSSTKVSLGKVELAPGETTSIEVTHTVTQKDLDDGKILNPAVFDVTDVNGTALEPQTKDAPVNGDITNSYTVDNQAVIADKDGAPLTEYSSVGDIVTYTLSLTNTGNGTLKTPMVKDTNSSTKVSLGKVELAPGETTSIEVTHTVTQKDLDDGKILNPAVFDVTDVNGTALEPQTKDAPVNGDITNSYTVDNQAVIADKDGAPLTEYSSVGDIVTYTLSLTNTGNGTLKTPMVKDTNSSTKVSLGKVELAPGETTSIEVTHTVTQKDLDDGKILNPAVFDVTDVNGTALEPQTKDAPVNGDTTNSYTVDNQAVIADKDGAPLREYSSVGDIVTYTLSLTNTGNGTLKTPMVKDTNSSTKVSLGKVELAPGETTSIEVTHTVTQKDLDDGKILNPAVFDVTDVNGTALEPQTKDAPVNGDITNSYTVDNQAVIADKDGAPLTEYSSVGDIVTYTLSLTNTGNGTLKTPMVKDTNSSTKVSLGKVELAPGETTSIEVTHTVTQKDLDDGKILNPAVFDVTDVNGTALEPQTKDAPVNGDTTNSYTVDNQAVIADKDGAPLREYSSVGDIVTYTLSLTNTGNGTLKTPMVKDTNSSTKVSLGKVELAPGETTSIEVTHTVTQKDLDDGKILNPAVFDVTDVNGTALEPQTKDAPVNGDITNSYTVDNQAVIADKDGAPLTEYSSVGDIVTYTLSLTNTGNGTLKTPMVKDTNSSTKVSLGKVELAPGETTSIEVTHTVTQKDLDDGKILNPAVFDVTDVNGTALEPQTKGAPVNGDITNSYTVDNQAVIADKDGAPLTEYSSVGDIVTYTLSLTNTGNGTLKTPMVKDTNSSTKVSLGKVELAPGETTSIEVTHTVTQKDLDDGKILNPAVFDVTDVNGTALEPQTKDAPVNGDITNSYTVDNQAVIADKDGAPLTEYSSVGDIVTYTLSLTNTGNGTLKTPMVKDTNSSTKVSLGKVELAPGETTSIEVTHTVTQKDLDDGKILNPAVFDVTDVNGTALEPQTKDAPVNGDITNSYTVDNQAVIADKDGAPLTEYSSVGDIVTYTLSLTNTGNGTLKTPMVKDTNSSTKVSLGKVELAPGETTSIEVTHTVTQKDLDDGKILNPAVFDVTDVNGTALEPQTKDAPVNGDITNSYTVDNQAVIADKDGAPLTEYSSVGDIVTYTLSLTNTGNGTLKTPMVKDTNSSTKVSLGKVELAPGETTSIEVTHTVTQKDLDDGKILNPAVFDVTDVNGTALEPQTKDAPVNGVFIVDLSIDKAVTDDNGNGKAETDEILKYTITVNNNSNITITDSKLTDTLASRFFQGQSPKNLEVKGTSYKGNLKTGMTLDSIPVGKSVEVTFEMTASYPADVLPGEKIENTANITYGKESKNAIAEVPVISISSLDLDIKLQVEDLGGDGFERGDGIVDDGEEAEYTISITNPTPVNALNVLVSDDYKGLYLYKNDSYKYVSFDGGKLTGKDLKEGVILPEIKAGETIKLKFMVGFSYEGKKVDQDDTIPNEAYLSLQEASPLKSLRRSAAPINKSSNKVVLNVAKPTYTLSKEIRNKKDEFYPGDVVVYDITLENTSAVVGKNIKIEDKVSEIKAFENWTWESGVSKTPESLLKIGLKKDLSENGIELLAGEIKRYTVVGRLKDSLSKGEVKNIVKAGENLELQAEAVLKVKDAQIKVTKTAKKKWVSIGDLISYKITVQNLSENKGTVLKNLSLKDMMPPGFKYAEGSGKVDGNDADEDLRGRTIYFNNLELIGDKKIEITYILRIGTGVKPGSYKNKAWIENTSGKNLSNIGEASVEVINDPLFNSTVIIGKVFHDRDNDGWQDDANAYDIRVENLSSQDNYLDGSVKKGDEEWRISSESKEVLLGNLGGRGDEREKSQKVILRRRIKDPKKIGDILIKSKEGSNITLKSTGEILRNHSGNRNLTGVDLKVVRRVIKDPKYREELKDVKSFKKVRIENFIEPIYFDSAYANIRDGENEKLKQYLEKLSNKKNLKLVIVGYTDSQRPSKRAKFKNNHELSIARANTLKDYLSMKLDLSEEMFVIDGKGPKNPKGSNRTSSGRQLNRRTEIVIEYDEEVTKQIPLKIDESDYFEEVEIRNDGILEEGIPGVRLATVEGLVIETDQFGRYHVDGIDDIPDRGKNFIIKVDKVTLPSGTEFTTENPRVKTLTKVMEKFNFGVKIPKAKRRIKEKEIKVRVGSVFFLTDKWNVREDQIDNLKKISKLLTEYRGGVIVVEGNADSRASNKYNQILALKRAKSIGKELEKIMGKEMISNVKIVTDLSGGER